MVEHYFATLHKDLFQYRFSKISKKICKGILTISILKNLSFYLFQFQKLKLRFKSVEFIVF